MALWQALRRLEPRLDRGWANAGAFSDETPLVAERGHKISAFRILEAMNFPTPQWHDELPSTNTTLAEWSREGRNLPDGYVLAARAQTAGRGRYQRRWLARPGRNLTFSTLLRCQAPQMQLLSLPMAAALGVAAYLEANGLVAQTKWPNDVLVDGRKICGILAERGEGVVLGMGLNVNMDADEAAAIDRPATSMRIETGREYAVEAVLDELLHHLAVWIGRWQAGGFAALREAWGVRCANIGEYVEVGEGADRRTGVVLGFGEAGQLLLREDDGTRGEVWTGDVGN